MNLLFKRGQAPGSFAGVVFRLWGKIELGEDEKEIIKRYRFDDAVLIAAVQPGLFRNAAVIAVVVFVLAFGFLSFNWQMTGGFLVSAIAAPIAGFWYYHESRETIYVRDLLRGRYFTCKSVIDLARKEAWLTTIVSFLRQVMESAKHWDGTERHDIEPLPKDEARQVIIRGI